MCRGMRPLMRATVSRSACESIPVKPHPLLSDGTSTLAAALAVGISRIGKANAALGPSSKCLRPTFPSREQPAERATEAAETANLMQNINIGAALVRCTDWQLQLSGNGILA